LQEDLSRISQWTGMSGESVNLSVGHVNELSVMAENLDSSSQNFVQQILQ
jgi:hypothetical protein